VICLLRSVVFYLIQLSPIPEVGAQIKNFNAQAKIAQLKFLIGKMQALIAQIKNKIGKALAQNAQVKNKFGKAQAQIVQLFSKI